MHPVVLAAYRAEMEKRAGLWGSAVQGFDRLALHAFGAGARTAHRADRLLRSGSALHDMYHGVAMGEKSVGGVVTNATKGLGRGLASPTTRQVVQADGTKITQLIRPNKVKETLGRGLSRSSDLIGHAADFHADPAWSTLPKFASRKRRLVRRRC